MRDVYGAYLSPGGQVAHSFMTSVARLRAVDERLIGNDLTHCRAGAGGIAEGRNSVTRDFLANPDAAWLWMVDSDMGFAPDTLDRLLATTTGEGAGAVGALCFALRIEGSDGMGGYRWRPQPTIYGWKGGGFVPAVNYPRDRLTRVAATGAGCLLIHRSVIEKVGGDWWTPVRDPADGVMLGEDLSFCYRLLERGIPVMVDTSIKTTHAKIIHLSEQDWDNYSMLLAVADA